MSLKGSFNSYVFLILMAAFGYGCGSFTDNEKIIIADAGRLLGQEANLLSQKNKEMLDDVKEAVYRTGERRMDMIFLDSAKSLYQSSNRALEYIIQLEEKIKKGERYKVDSLKLTLNEYSAKLQNVFTKKDRYVHNFDPNNNPAIYLRASMMLAEDINFKNTLLFLDYLKSLKAVITMSTDEALRALAGQVSIDCFFFNIIHPVIVPESKIVDEGDEYKASIVLTSENVIRPEITIEGRKIVSEPYGVMKYSFKAEACTDDSSELCEKRWEGTLKINYKGNDSIIPIGQNYYVRKPCKR